MKNLRGLAAGIAVLAFGSSWVRAADAQLRFDWQAPESCPSRERVLERATELLGRAPESALAAELELSARAAPVTDGTWQLDLSSRTDSGPTSARTVTAASCAELADAAALLLALAIDPALSERASSHEATSELAPPGPPPLPDAPGPASLPTRLPAPASSARPLEPVVAAARHSDTPPSRVPFRWRVGAAFAAWAHRLPGLAPGFMAHAGASRGAGWGVLTLGGFPGSRASVPGSAAGGDLSLLSGGGQLGYALAVARRLELAPVVGAEVEWVHGSGSGVAHPADGDLLLLSFAGGGRAALPLSAGWAMFGQGLLSGLVTRPRFVLEGLGELYQPPGWGFCFSLGAEWRPP